MKSIYPESSEVAVDELLSSLSPPNKSHMSALIKCCFCGTEGFGVCAREWLNARRQAEKSEEPEVWKPGPS